MKKIFLFQFFLFSFAADSFALDVYSPWIQGGLIIGKTDLQSKLSFMGKELQLTSDGRFVIGLGRDVPANASIKETLSSGEVIVHQFNVEQRVYKEQRVNGVPKRTVDVPEKALTRIREEVSQTKNARNILSDRVDFLDSFDWPARGIISGVYGSRRYYNGKPRRPHFGVDIAAPEGSPVYAPISGKVSLVHPDMYFSGGTLIVDHGHGVSSTFIHLSKILVKEGEVITKGQEIAKIGSTGRATGPHLDWRMNWFDQRLDPQLLLKDLPKPLN